MTFFSPTVVPWLFSGVIWSVYVEEVALYKVNQASDFCKMDTITERALIQYLHKKGLAPKDIHTDMIATLANDAPSYATMKNWVVDFKHDRQSL